MINVCNQSLLYRIYNFWCYGLGNKYNQNIVYYSEIKLDIY